MTPTTTVHLASPSGKHSVGEKSTDGCTVFVLDRDHPSGGYPLDPRFDLRRHADGLNFGFAGSGPAQLSLALLADALGDDEQALLLHQIFQFRELARWEGDEFRIRAEEIRHIVAGLEAERNRRR